MLLATDVLRVTLLTGFLGAGKTTLINHLLKNSPDQKIAIIENEFAATNIDAQLLTQSPHTQIIELANGCVCCTIKGALPDALMQLYTAAMFAIQNQQPTFQHIIIETTGLADPGPIIQTFFAEENLRDKFVLDAVITLVDAKHLTQQLSEHAVAAAQIGFADRLLITKQDLVNETEWQFITQRLTNINCKALQIPVHNGNLAKEKWLNLHAFETEQTPEQILRHFNISSATHAPASLMNNNSPSFDDRIQSFTLTAESPLDIEKISYWMEQLIEEYGHDLLRYKGILSMNNSQTIVIQGVYKIAGFDEITNDSQRHQSLLVLIGRELPFQKLQQSFSACIA